MLLATYALVALLPALSPAAARFFLARFHLRSESFALWSLTQLAPWMYNFENRALLSPRRLSARELASPPDGLRWYAINHQVAHVMTFVELRAREYARPSRSYVYLESRYRDQVVSTTYELEAPGPSHDAAWTLRLLEGAP